MLFAHLKAAGRSTHQPVGRIGRWDARRYFWGYVFVVPWVVGFLVFQLGPLLTSLFLSFTKYDIITPLKWTGLSNIRRIFTDDLALKALANTSLFVAISVPLRIAAALALALLLDAKLAGRNILRAVYYLPSVTAGVAISAVWQLIYHPLVGPINNFLKLFGVVGPRWLGDPQWALLSLVIMGVWIVAGRYMVIFLAALQGVPEQVYEAATIDGANGVQRFFRITLPLLSSTIYLVTVVGVIHAFEIFTYAFVMTGGGPANATLVYILYLYRKGFQDFEMGYASALAWFLFVIMFTITLIQNALQKRWVYYESKAGL